MKQDLQNSEEEVIYTKLDGKPNLIEESCFHSGTACTWLNQYWVVW